MTIETGAPREVVWRPAKWITSARLAKNRRSLLGRIRVTFMPHPTRRTTLKQRIAAILIGKQSESESEGVFTQLPAGSRIQICGAGFNEQTISVRCRSELYVVFRYDVDDCC